ncbi:hypothetical protein CO009_02965, partial [Candidatus Shapirobacteria bacterium CG_4_8_14_3_um_filter_35_11]
DKQKISLSQIEGWCKTHQTTSFEFFKSLKTITLKENLKEGYFESKAHEIKKKSDLGVAGMFGLAFLVTSSLIVSGLLGANLGLISMLFICPPIMFVYFALLIVMRFRGEKRSKKGRTEAAGWKAFKKHLKEYKQTVNYPIDSIILWEKYLVYGTVLGVSAKALSALPVKFNEVDMATGVMYWGRSNFYSGNFGSDFSGI